MTTLDEPGTLRLGLPKSMRGAAVMKVFPDSPLAKHFRPLDVIQKVNGRAIRGADDVAKALDGRAKGNRWKWWSTASTTRAPSSA